VLRRGLPALLVILMAAAACSGGSSAGSSDESSGPTVPQATTLPASGTVQLPNHLIYTVVPPGQTLRLDDIALKIHHISWSRTVPGAVKPPGTSTFAIVDVTVANRTSKPQKVGPTQIWLIDAAAQPFLASPAARVPRPVIGRPIAPGASYTGNLTFGLPRRLPGGLLVYRFADADAIAHAKQVGVARYAPAT
jgi:hypothetical protein